jgi:CheY-like chemotaxis protein
MGLKSSCGVNFLPAFFWHSRCLAIQSYAFSLIQETSAAMQGAPVSPSVIVIEDDRDTAATIEQLLLLENIPCKSVNSREAAIHLIRKGARPPCILVDYMMPGMSLAEFVDALSESGARNSRLVLATAYSCIEEVAMRHGIRYMLRKPFDPDELLKVVKSAVESGQHRAIVVGK